MEQSSLIIGGGGLAGESGSALASLTCSEALDGRFLVKAPKTKHRVFIE